MCSREICGCPPLSTYGKGPKEPQTVFTKNLGSHHLIERGTNMFPAWLRDDCIGNNDTGTWRANLSGTAQRYLDRLGANMEDLFHYVLAVLHDPAYREANAGALRMEWPRIPLPDWPEGETEGAAVELAQSAAHGRDLATLLDSETSVLGVTTGALRPEIAAIAVPATTGGRNMAGDDFMLTAGWGHYGTGGAVMPGQGRAVERAYTPDERTAMGDSLLAPWRKRPSMFISTATPSGAMSLPPSGGTSSAAIRSSRNGFPTVNAIFSGVRSGSRKSSISPTQHDESGRYWER